MLITAFCKAEVTTDGKIAPSVYHRTVFLGDSITDGDTYPKLVRDALAGAGLPPMISINAGIGGDTAKGMRARLDRDVLAHHPTLVTLSVGANDAAYSVAPEIYETDVRAIADRLKQEQIPVLILTPNIAGPKFASRAQKSLDAYEQILRKIAKEQSLRVAEVNIAQKKDEASGRHQLAPDDVHPNWEGQTSIARAVLDAMGYPQVKVPAKIAESPLPGVIAQWKMYPAPLSNDKTVPPIVIHLPEPRPEKELDTNDRWLDGYRAQGASISLRNQTARKFVGMTTIHSESARKVQFHTGGDLTSVKLNGQVIYENKSRRGYHIGRESVWAGLKAGENAVVIETGPVFFLSVTDGQMWEGMGH